MRAAAEALGVAPAEAAAAQKLAGDAGTRCYYRLPDGPISGDRTSGGRTSGRRSSGRRSSGRRLLVTYPEPFTPAQRNWTAIRLALAESGVRVPELFADAPEAGAALIEDFGDRDLAAELGEAPPVARAELLEEAEAILPLLRQVSLSAASRNPRFDAEFFSGELAQTRHWLLEGGGARPLSSSDLALWEAVSRDLANRAAGRDGTAVPTHRDFHANNILRAPDGRLAVIDFQDLRLGPPDYDRVSLRFERGGTLVDSDPSAYDEAVLLQRAWKVVGTFAKLLSWGRRSYRPFFEAACAVIRAHTRPSSDFAPLLRFLPEDAGDALRV